MYAENIISNISVIGTYRTSTIWNQIIQSQVYMHSSPIALKRVGGGRNQATQLFKHLNTQEKHGNLISKPFKSSPFYWIKPE